MFHEQDRPEPAPSAQPVEQSQLAADEAARRRVQEFDASLLDCEHTGNTAAENTAVDRSVGIMDQWERDQDPAARRKMLEGVGREMMDVHEAPPAPTVARDMPPTDRGAYHDLEFSTDLNRKQLEQDDPKGALETYLHEYRHAEQHYEIQKSQMALAHETDADRAAAMEYNRDHYMDGHKDFDAYKQQLMEVDARQFAAETAGEILQRRERLHDAGPDEALYGSDADRIARERLLAEGERR